MWRVIDRMAEALAALRERGGRLFFLGVGGSAGNCSHAVNDFRKIAGIEAYAPTDNVSELTARTNDEGWETVFAEWLKVSRLRSGRRVFIFSVGGGNLEKNISPNLVRALQYAKTVGATILGIVGRDGGYTAQGRRRRRASSRPSIAETVTPHSEAFQAVVWHLLVSHPALKASADQMGDRPRTMRTSHGASRLPRSRRRAQPGLCAANGKPYPPATRRGAGHRCPACPRRLARLRPAGFRLVVVDQSARRRARHADARACRCDATRICASCCRSTRFDICFHDDADDCDCRKPKPGMLLHAARARRDRARATASWSATAGATSRPGIAPDAAPILHRSTATARPSGAAGRYREFAYRGRRLDSRGNPNAQGLIMPSVNQLKVKIFADGADMAGMLEMYGNPHIKGFTTNPTLMRKAGVTDYEASPQGYPRRRSPTARSRSRCSPTSSPRWSARPGASRPGARTCTSRSRSPTRRRKARCALVRKLSQEGVAAERHRAVDARAGARGGRRA